MRNLILIAILGSVYLLGALFWQIAPAVSKSVGCVVLMDGKRFYDHPTLNVTNNCPEKIVATVCFNGNEQCSQSDIGVNRTVNFANLSEGTDIRLWYCSKKEYSSNKCSLGVGAGTPIVRGGESRTDTVAYGTENFSVLLDFDWCLSGDCKPMGGKFTVDRVGITMDGWPRVPFGGSSDLGLYRYTVERSGNKFSYIEWSTDPESVGAATVFEFTLTAPPTCVGSPRRIGAYRNDQGGVDPVVNDIRNIRCKVAR